MLQFEELRLRLLGHEDALKDLADALGLEKMKKEIEELDAKTAENGFWDDVANTQVVLQKIASLKNKIQKYENLKASYEDDLTMIELSDEEEDLDMLETNPGAVRAKAYDIVLNGTELSSGSILPILLSNNAFKSICLLI